MLSPEIVDGCVGYPADGHYKLAAFEESSFWYSHRNQLIRDVFLKYFTKKERFLDVGCGTGLVLSTISRTLPAIALYGVDAYLHALKIARSRVPEAKYWQLDITTIPFREEFDVIGAFDVLEHLEDDAQLLCELHKALKPGGFLILTVPQYPWLYSIVDKEAGHRRRYRAADLKEKIAKAGFHIHSMTSFFCLLFPLMAASRLFRKLPFSQKQQAVCTEMNLNPVFNRLFKGICKIEKVMVDHTISMPFGGSLMCIAKKSIVKKA